MNDRQRKVLDDLLRLAKSDEDVDASVGMPEDSDEVVAIVYNDQTAVLTPDEGAEVAHELARTAQEEGWLDSTAAFIAVYLREVAAVAAGNRSERYLKDRFGDFDPEEDYDTSMVDFGRLGRPPSVVSTHQ